MIRRLRQWWRAGPGRGDVLGINRRNLDLVFADYRPGKFRQLDDKIAGKAALEAAGVPVPRTLASIAGPGDLDLLDDLLAGRDDLVIKPAKGWGGRGILVLARSDGRWRRPGGAPVGTEAVRAHVADILAGIHSLDEDADVALVEERIVPHPFYAELGPAGLSDLRIVLDGLVPVQAMCRVPTAASDGKANLHGGGLGLGVDLADGRITGAIAGGRPVARHPDTGLELVGRRLPAWDRSLAVAAAAAAAVPVEYVGVDIVVDRARGPLVLEVNARPGLAIQVANARGQAVRPRLRETPGERRTFVFNWVLLAALAAAPLLYQGWQDRHTESLAVVVGGDGPRAAVALEPRDETALAAEGSAIELEELSIAASDSAFAAARTAAAAGDTAAAVALYRSVLPDSALAPFALNNLAVLARRSGNDSLALARLQEAVDRFPSYHRGYYNLGLALEEAGRTREARRAYERALEFKPNHAAAWAALGSLRFGAGEYDGAAEAFALAIRYEPTATGPRLKLGLTERLRGDLAEARTVLADLLALDPGNEAAAYWLARTGEELALAEAPDPLAPALAEWRAVLAPFRDDSPRCRSLDAQLAYESGDLAAALADFGALAQDRYRPSHHALAEALVSLELGLWRRAAAAAHAARDYAPGPADHLLLLADLGSALDGTADDVPEVPVAAPPMLRLAAAALGGDEIRAGRVLLELENAAPPVDLAWPRWLAAAAGAGGSGAGGTLDIPDDLHPHCTAARGLDARLEPDAGCPLAYGLLVGHGIALRRGDEETAARFLAALHRRRPAALPVLRESFDRALAVAGSDSARLLGDRIVALGAEDPLLTLTLAELHRRQGDESRARELLESLPEAHRRTPAALTLAGRLELAAGRPRRAIDLLRRATAGDAADVGARHALGEALYAAGRNGAAEKELRQALNLDPGRADVRRSLAAGLMQQRRYADAAREWRVLLSLDEGDLSARFNLALSLQRAGDDAAALPEYERILAVQPDRPSAVFNRALALDRLGRRAEARAGYRHMLELVPDHEASRRKLAEMQREGDSR